MDDNTVYATGLTNIYAIKSSTGAVKFKSPLPDELNMGTGLPDILQFVWPEYRHSQRIGRRCCQ